MYVNAIAFVSLVLVLELKPRGSSMLDESYLATH